MAAPAHEREREAAAAQAPLSPASGRHAWDLRQERASGHHLPTTCHRQPTAARDARSRGARPAALPLGPAVCAHAALWGRCVDGHPQEIEKKIMSCAVACCSTAKRACPAACPTHTATLHRKHTPPSRPRLRPSCPRPSLSLCSPRMPPASRFRYTSLRLPRRRPATKDNMSTEHAWATKTRSSRTTFPFYLSCSSRPSSFGPVVVALCSCSRIRSRSHSLALALAFALAFSSPTLTGAPNLIALPAHVRRQPSSLWPLFLRPKPFCPDAIAPQCRPLLLSRPRSPQRYHDSVQSPCLVLSRSAPPASPESQPT